MQIEGQGYKIQIRAGGQNKSLATKLGPGARAKVGGQKTQIPIVIGDSQISLELCKVISL